MTVGDLVKKLLEFDQSLPVCLADWQEQYADLNEEVAECVGLAENSLYWPSKSRQKKKGTYVCIGG